MEQAPEYLHPFEKAGLGKAPFRCVGVSRKVGPIRYVGKDGCEVSVGAPGQPMGCCAYCATGIAECYEILSSDGKRFIVGCDCVAKTSAKGSRVLNEVEALVRKRRNEAARERNAIKAQASKAELTALLADPEFRAKLAAKPSAYAWKAEKGETALDDAEWLARNCGHSGRARLLAKLQK